MGWPPEGVWRSTGTVRPYRGRPSYCRFQGHCWQSAWRCNQAEIPRRGGVLEHQKRLWVYQA
eukprot:5693579-Prymnesium_polylepis.1